MSKQQLSPSNRAHVEQFLNKVEAERAQATDEWDVERLLAEMQSPDPTVRARAVRQICPCKMPWGVFHRLRKAAKQLQHDPDPDVRANALHIEEDARMVASMEGEMERLHEFEDEEEERNGARKRHKHRRR